MLCQHFLYSQQFPDVCNASLNYYQFLIMEKLLEKIKTKKAKIGIIGLGYVGLPLALEFVRSGYCVTGIDRNKDHVASLNRGKSYIGDVKDEDIAQFVEKRLFL